MNTQEAIASKVIKEKSKSFDLELLFRALADKTRLRLLNLISDGEICVCYFVEIFSENQSKISRHLAYLRRARIVEARRDGKWMHYRLAEMKDAHAAQILTALRASFAEDKAMQRDRLMLARIGGAARSSNTPVQLQRAPRPKIVDNFFN